MKKNSFMEGAFVATAGIIIVKIIGLLYVVPFNAIIGEKGGALYGYAYNIYMLFLAISSAGFPFAISKLVSEYSTLGYKKAIRDTYKVATNIIMFLSVIIFILLFIFAPQIGRLIIGSKTGGNSISDIAFVIRMISFAILVVPFLSVTKGFLQGYKYISPSTMSQIIEQLIRVIVILVGSFVTLKLMGLELKYVIGISVTGAFFGGLIAYLYLRAKIKKNNLLPGKEGKNKDNKIITKKEICIKIFKYSIPFIAINLINNLYNTVDMILLSRTMSDILNFSISRTESVVSIFTTWGIKLNNILLAVTTGITTSLIPNIVSSYTAGNMKDVINKFNKAMQCILLIIVPMTIFLSLLSKPVWTLFYGESIYGPLIYKVFVFGAVFGGLYGLIVNALQGLNKYKLVITSVLTGLLINTILDIPFMLLCHKLNIEASYGAIFASIIGYFISIITSMYILKKKYNFEFKDTFKKLPNYIISWVIFTLIIVLFKLFIPINLNGRLIQIPILIAFGVISFGIYILINYKNGNITNLFDFKRLKNKKKI